MNAIMKDNLVARYKEIFPNEPLDTKDINFLNRISGNIVNLIFTHGDAFEELDNNIWLPHSLWEKI